MLVKEAFKARGHQNIKASHRTTLMVTKDPELSLRGDCIVAVSSEKGLLDLNQKTKDAIRSKGSKVTLTLEIGGCSFEVHGFGDERLPLSHPSDIVVRKSGYICERTLMVFADKAAYEIPLEFVKRLQNLQSINVAILVES
ncbi:DUF371 domain-containing protein [Candidatus Bathyarchaeota archaeon]|nr:DUF371 domain-containing protein [Candidatus Bathyarchaeota archaeon]MBS7631545.1 DUF371 domain-containing protein [Candidatus Bathyarchaeota archaeon]